MRMAVIDGTAVVNVIEAEPGFELDGFTLVPSDKAAPGWTFHPGINTFSPPEEPQTTPADFTLTRRQVRSALVLNGFPVDAIPQALATIPDPTERALAQIDWEDAPYYQRDHPLFSDPDILAALGIAPEMVDAMWMQAKDLPA